MNGILLKDKPTPIVVLNSNLDFRYTTDGTEPDLMCQMIVRKYSWVIN
jgi:hypothetical protein